MQIYKITVRLQNIETYLILSAILTEKNLTMTTIDNRGIWRYTMIMNILHLKYAMEIARVGSINKAAANLFIAQPNLSRAIKELESSLGITIFLRTPKGMVLTSDGEKLLHSSRGALNQLEQIEEMFQSGRADRQIFSVTAPRASYISYAFAQFTQNIESGMPAELYYKETDSLSAINHVLNGNYRLGIVRYASVYDKFYKNMFQDKRLNAELITEFSFQLLVNRDSPLAVKETVSYKDLKSFIEIAHSDSYIPSLPVFGAKNEELPEYVDKRIYVFERGSQFDILSANPNTFMWVSGIPGELLEKHKLVQRRCEDSFKVYKDVLIYKKEYKPTKLDHFFLRELGKSKQSYINNDITIC